MRWEGQEEGEREGERQTEEFGHQRNTDGCSGAADGLGIDSRSLQEGTQEGGRAGMVGSPIPGLGN